MELATTERVWSRSVERRKLCYTTSIGDGDGKSFQLVRERDPYNGVTIHKGERLALVSKRLKMRHCKQRRTPKIKLTSNAN